MKNIYEKKDIKLYCQHMEEIKNRVAIIRRFLASGISFGNEFYDYEVVSLHLRKILELIVFANLTANKTEYSKVHQDFEKKWSAKKLIVSIEKINQNFYPQPLVFIGVKPNGVKHLDFIKDGFLTKEEWIKLYDLCSKVLHVWNPYDRSKKSINFESTITGWLDRIETLLTLHYVRLPLQDHLWLIYMRYPEDGKVHAFPTESLK